VTFEAVSQLIEIEYDAFFHCSSLSTIRIPASVERLSCDAFDFCRSLSRVEFDRGSKLSGSEKLFYRYVDRPLRLLERFPLVEGILGPTFVERFWSHV
jgi:hypothetical protein